MKVILCVLICASFALNTNAYVLKSSATLSLNGTWRATNSNGSIVINATVPGGIYTDLMRAGIIGDPYYRNNDELYKWIGRDNWTFYNNFDVECEVLQKDRVILVLHGLDTVCQITLNGNYIRKSENMFIRHIFNIKDILKAKNNSLTIQFTSAVTYAEDQHNKQLRDYVIPPTCPPPIQKGECHVNYVRKVQSSFSWDWGPSFPSQGIWKPVEIIGFDTCIIKDITVNTIKSTSQNGITSWSLNMTIFYDLASNQVQSNISILLDNVLLKNTSVVLNASSNLTTSISFLIQIPEGVKIKEWWPNGLGNQELYKLRVISWSRNEKTFKVLKIGFRVIELIQEPAENSTGLSFYFKVNGVPFFAKGSNWIPADSFLERVSNNYITSLLQSAKDANMNMLRVWGGGTYESDHFYQTADALGILIWQDIMFACSLYPTTTEFLDSVSLEVELQVRRLQYHPSLLLWAGNNENEQALVQNWWPAVSQNRQLYKSDYLKLYIDTIMPIVEREDSSRPFLSSSPSNGKHTEQEGWISRDPQSNTFGDVHFYTYNRDSWDWRSYPRARFVSEYGFQSYPSFESFKQVSDPSDWTYPSSSFLTHRQHHMFGNLELSTDIAKHLWLPSPECGQKSFDDLLYLSQITQAMGIKTETEFYRRCQSDVVNGEGRTMGALYWQLNDIWQGPSWSSIEYGGKWKILHYFAKNFFAALLVSPYEEEGVLKVSVISDFTNEIQNLSLSVCVQSWASFDDAYCESINFNQPALTSQLVLATNISGEGSLLQQAHCQSRLDCFLHLSLSSAEGKLMKPNNFMFLSELNKAIGLLPTNITITGIVGPFRTKTSNYTFQIHLSTTNVALFVWLDIPAVSGTFSENGFLFNKPTKTVLFYSYTDLQSQDLLQNLHIRSLTDVCS